MKDEDIKEQWENFITEYKEYFPNNPTIQTEVKPAKKLTTIPQKEQTLTKETSEQIRKRKQSEYQELTKKMSIQNSATTNQMFIQNQNLWYQYHDNRDFSFKGYDNQGEIPVNKIITYLETKSNKKLNILDLGCGRNLIKEHFKLNKKLNITGYDHVSFNGSISCDISKLPEIDESVDICVYSQSLMGSNWKEYLNEGFRVLRYNGEMIISESIDRYNIIREYIDSLKYVVKDCNNNPTNRWFYLYVLNDNKI